VVHFGDQTKYFLFGDWLADENTSREAEVCDSDGIACVPLGTYIVDVITGTSLFGI